MRNKLFDALFKSNNTVTLYSITDLRKILSRERARSDRNNHEFSMIVFELENHKRHKKALGNFCQFLASRLRSIDELGWFGENQIGVVLPYTVADDAAVLAKNIHARSEYCDLITKIQVFAYPTVWPFKKTDNSGTDSTQNGIITGKANVHYG